MTENLNNGDMMEEHSRRVASFPEAVRDAHLHCSKHRAELIGSARCGCFYCCRIFVPIQIENWIDEANGEGQTALCPYCHIDSVIGDKSGFEISKEFLEIMKSYWF